MPRSRGAPPRPTRAWEASPPSWWTTTPQSWEPSSGSSGEPAFQSPHGITDPTLARDLVRSGGFDLVILDLHMPEMDGFAVMASLRQVLEPEEYLPILVLTGDDDPALRREALNAGAMDFLNKPFEPSEAEARARNLLATRFLTQRVAHQRDSMEEARQSTSSCSPTRPSAPRSSAAAPTGSSRSPATSP